eukprot:364690-Chlamydomonas_euryale.AAC.8
MLSTRSIQGAGLRAAAPGAVCTPSLVSLTRTPACAAPTTDGGRQSAAVRGGRGPVPPSAVSQPRATSSAKLDGRAGAGAGVRLSIIPAISAVVEHQVRASERPSRHAILTGGGTAKRTLQGTANTPPSPGPFAGRCRGT